MARPKARVSDDVLQGLLKEAEAQLVATNRGTRRAATHAGLVERLSIVGGAPVRWPPDLRPNDTSAEQARRAGVLARHLIATSVREHDWPADSDMCGASMYAAALASPQAQKALAERTDVGLLKAHTLGCAMSPGARRLVRGR